MTMMQVTADILNKAVKLAREHGLNAKDALDEAYSDEIGFGSTDMLSASVLAELHSIGLLLTHKIRR